MSAPVPSLRCSYAEDLAAERASDTKHEYLRVEIFAMSGGTPEHARLAARVTRLLDTPVEDRACNVFRSDLRVRIVATDLATYPDVTVVCGVLEAAPEGADAVVDPTLLVEVLSDSTESYDRGQKFGHFRRIASLREYLLVNQHEPRLEVFTRSDGGGWLFAEAGPGDTIELASVGVHLVVDAAYRNNVAALEAGREGLPASASHVAAQ